MKKGFVLFFLCLIITYLSADEILQPAQQSKDFEFKGKIDSGILKQNREQDPPPNYSFILNGDNLPTTYLYDSYYDYMPFSYNGFNIRLQPEISLPFGYAAEGFYISYHCSETTTIATDRRAWNSYLNPDATLLISSATNHYGVFREGFTSVDIDPYTGDPLFVWHSIVEADNSHDCSMTYDIFHLTGATGYWKTPFIIFDNPEIGESLTGHTGTGYIWPVVMIDDSPLPDHRRVYVYANNAAPNSALNWGYNTLLAYADFNADNLMYESEFNWTYQTFPYFDNLHYNDLGRANKDMVVKGNKVALFGTFSGGDSLFCMYSDDYGENFTLYSQEWLYPVENPLWEDGETYQFLDNDETTPSVLFFTLSYDGSHFNGVFTDNDTKILWMTGININSQENIAEDVYWPAYFYPKIFMFDIDTGTFSFYEMDIQGADPDDDQPAIPWDLDEDGEVDEFYDDGSVYIPLSMPSWFYNTDQGYQDAFAHESAFRMIANENWIVAGWHDCKKLRWAYWGIDGYDGWIKQPELVISISDDYGETWSESRFINANPNDAIVDSTFHYDGNYAPEFEDMLPVYLAFGEELEVLSNEPDNYHAKLHIGFFDDNDYGGAAGSSEGSGQLNGGKLRYAALDIEFQEPWIPGFESTDDNTIAPGIAHLGQNYPNPFNPAVAGRSPCTTISFFIAENSENAEISIYNIKGQKVKTLVNKKFDTGEHSVVWDGRDKNNKLVSSGLYFYKLQVGKFEKVRKMILLR
jgi:hypothetical protein